MKTIRRIFALVSGDNTHCSTESRPRVRREAVCEMLEGRQLLSTAASTVASGTQSWHDAGSFRVRSGDAPSAAEIAHFDSKGGHHDVHAEGTANFVHHGDSGSSSSQALNITWNNTSTA